MAERFCSQCGGKLAPNALFCGRCGTKVSPVPTEVASPQPPVTYATTSPPAPAIVQGHSMPHHVSTAPQKKRSLPTWAIVLLVCVALLMVISCPLMFIIGIPVMNASSESAQARECFANQRSLEGAGVQYLVESMDHDVRDLDGSAWVEVLVYDYGYLSEAPECPAGEEYRMLDGEVEPCDEHGAYSQE